MRTHVQALPIYIIATLALTSNGQDCVDIVNVNQRGFELSSNIRQVIVSGSDFLCNGRVTGYLISFNSRSNSRGNPGGNSGANPGGNPGANPSGNSGKNSRGNSGGFPTVQVWRLTNMNTGVYSLVGRACPLTDGDVTMMSSSDSMDDFYLGNVSCVNDSRIEFQSGDIIGYSQGSPSQYRLGIINAMGFKSYGRMGNGGNSQTFNINDVMEANIYNNTQPLIQMIVDIRCDNLSAPANGEILSCNSGTLGVGYEGDTCSFTCNTGYELTGSDTRTCQSDGSWSGSDVMCIAMATSANTRGITHEITSNTIVTSDTVLSATPIIEITTSTTLSTSDVATDSALINSFTARNSFESSVILTTGPCTDSAIIYSFTTSSGFKSSMIFTISPSTDSTLVSSFATSSSFESSTIFTTSSSTDFTQLADARQQQNDDSGSNNVGIIAGCIVAVIVFVVVIICVIIFLILYRIKKKKGTSCSDVYVADGYESCDYHQYDKINDEATYESPGLSTHKNDGATNDAVIANSVCYSSTDKIVRDLNDKASETMPEMNTIHTTYHRKPQHGDYEALPTLDNCEASHYEMSDITDQCEVAIPSNNRDSTKDIVMDESPADDEQIYKDPGHKKEKIYEWFEKMKFRKLESDDIKILQELGSGEFGIVHLGLWLDGSTDPVQVAVKTLNSQCSESDKVRFLREAAIMGQFKHDNVVRLHGVVTDEENMMIAMEFMPKGDLREYLLNLKTTTPSDACNNLKHDLLSFCRQIAAGMDFLMSKKFVHRDLAARNMLLSNDFVCKIADFGMARDVADDTYYIITGGKFPLKWTAPEPLFYKKFSIRSDIWSFGCVMYEVWSLGHKPFDDIDGKQYVQKIITGYRLPPPPGCPIAMYELMIQCWHPTPRSRPTSGSILETLQKSDRALLTNSVQIENDDLNQSMMLGAPLDEGSKLYLDLQQRYIEKSS